LSSFGLTLVYDLNKKTVLKFIYGLVKNPIIGYEAHLFFGF